MSDYADDHAKYQPGGGYTGYWPGQGHVDVFTTVTETSVKKFKDRDAPLPPRKINAELNRLRSAIERLSPETREEIGYRELRQWQGVRPDKTVFDDKYFKQSAQLQNAGSRS